jgi:hypothetical protein
MKLNVSPYTLRILCSLGFLLVSGAGLTGCDYQQARPLADTSASFEEEGPLAQIDRGDNSQQANSLTQNAIRTTFPAEAEIAAVPVPDYALDFVGRYHTQIDCDGHFAPCTEGKAEFILTLLPDGTLHRSIVQYGKVFNDNARQVHANSNMTYRKERWSINPQRTELVVVRKEGAKFYYTIKNNNRLVMNLEKNYSEKERVNQELFNQGYPAPPKAYELRKDPQSQTDK